MTKPKITVQDIFISHGLQKLKLPSYPRMHVVTHYRRCGSTISV